MAPRVQFFYGQDVLIDNTHKAKVLDWIPNKEVFVQYRDETWEWIAQERVIHYICKEVYIQKQTKGLLVLIKKLFNNGKERKRGTYEGSGIPTDSP